jgi:hypothetical protein
MFLRPDLRYLQSFKPIFQQMAFGKKSGLCVPLWQGFGGCNDRFAIANSQAAARCYAQRIDWAIDYCLNTKKPLHAEKFLLYRIQKNQIPLWFMSIQGSRVRAGGVVANENYRILRESNIPVAWHALKKGFANAR